MLFDVHYVTALRGFVALVMSLLRLHDTDTDIDKSFQFCKMNYRRELIGTRGWRPVI